ncbi:PH domain-containing protein, partial [Mycobacteroides abscessus subsp. massiliense]
MGYPENVLADDEQVVLHRHSRRKRLSDPALRLTLYPVIASCVAVMV